MRNEKRAGFQNVDPGEGIRKIGDRLVDGCTHVHDNYYEKDLHLMPYMGKLDWSALIRALKDIDYKGVFSLETAPPSSLPEHIYDKMYASLAELARWMVKDL